jgi:beta-lactamase class A
MHLSEKLDVLLRDFGGGRAGVAIEVDGEGFYHNSSVVFQSASVIKIPILIEGLRQCELGRLDLDRLILVDHGRVGGSGVLQALSQAASVTVKDLLTLMMIVSDNIATNLLIDMLGIESLNTSFVGMGLQDTVLDRRMMDFDAIGYGLDNFTSPRDMLACLKIVAEGTYLSEASRAMAMEIMGYQQFLDKLPAMLDLDQVFIANKTGSLPGVEHDCAIFRCNGKTAYVAVLMDQLTDAYDGRQLISKIGKCVFEWMDDGM